MRVAIHDENDSELACDYTATPYRPATRLEPAEGGIELDYPVTRDGVDISWSDVSAQEVADLEEAARQDQESRAARFAAAEEDR